MEYDKIDQDEINELFADDDREENEDDKNENVEIQEDPQGHDQISSHDGYNAIEFIPRERRNIPIPEPTCYSVEEEH